MAYLAPEPPEPFASLTEAIVERWPDYPPYEGIHETVIPHLTVAYGDDSLLAEVEADVTPKLPIEAHVTEAVLLEELEPDFALARARPLPAQIDAGSLRWLSKISTVLARLPAYRIHVEMSLAATEAEQPAARRMVALSTNVTGVASSVIQASASRNLARTEPDAAGSDRAARDDDLARDYTTSTGRVVRSP